ncbi:hypothetical protein D4764_06G0009460 [Takifugu flavidus]|uniref:Uncharacterized protein n=1 Tax=Takifugu flavidus TaxID=433684 RepID=A0A5C6MWG7_9TELE|nr:hypothetical protein D4764_06G0009460 [Takifugu flavidus]
MPLVDRGTHGKRALDAGHRGPLPEPSLGVCHVGEHLLAGSLPMESGRAQPEEATWDPLPVGSPPAGGIKGSGKGGVPFKVQILPQVVEFKYLGVLFSSEGRLEQEINRQIGAASAVMRTLHRSVVVKRELSQKAKLSIYGSIFVPTLTYGHALWGEKLCHLGGAEPLLLRVERNQMRWIGHLVRMPPGHLPGEVFRAYPSSRRPPGRPRTRWRDYVSRLVWERPGAWGSPWMSWKK